MLDIYKARTQPLHVLGITSNTRYAGGPPYPILWCFLLVLILMTGFSRALADTRGRPSPVTAYDADGRSLGSVSFVNSCASVAQPFLRRGLALMHHMTFEDALEAFKLAQSLDSECAMAFWGAAMTHLHPLWPDSLSLEAQDEGKRWIAQARKAANSSERELAYIDVIAAYYTTEGGERAKLAAYRDKWQSVVDAWPEDLEARLFYARSILANASKQDKTYPLQREAGAIAEKVLQEIPDHPGAHHYIIHAYDVPPLAEKALEVARSYDNVAPENTHALHMTSHIFTQLGFWVESAEFNARALKASADRLSNGGISLHHLHALDFLVYAELQKANDREAAELQNYLNTLQAPFQDHIATANAFTAIPSRLALERRNWALAAKLDPRLPKTLSWSKYPYLIAMLDYSRALGAIHTGDLKAAAEFIERLGVLREAAVQLSGAYDWATQVAVREDSARAWLSFVQGDTELALTLIAQAAKTQVAIGRSPGSPGPILPALEIYGDMLLQLGEYARALSIYEISLEQSPGRFWSLYGAGRAAELAGDKGLATQYFTELVNNCPEPTASLAELNYARDFISAE